MFFACCVNEFSKLQLSAANACDSYVSASSRTRMLVRLLALAFLSWRIVSVAALYLRNRPSWSFRYFWSNLSSLWSAQVRMYGWRHGGLYTIVPFTLLLGMNHACLVLDDIFLLTSWRSVKVVQPIFVVGMPRSGTTFLHRMLNGNGHSSADSQFVCWSAWDLLLPALCTRPLAAFAAMTLKCCCARRKWHHTLGYDFALSSHAALEEEWLGVWSLSSPIVTGLTALAHGGGGGAPFVLATQPAETQDALLHFTRRLFQRQLWHTGKARICAKPLHWASTLRTSSPPLSLSSPLAPRLLALRCSSDDAHDARAHCHRRALACTPSTHRRCARLHRRRSCGCWQRSAAGRGASFSPLRGAEASRPVT